MTGLTPLSTFIVNPIFTILRQMNNLNGLDITKYEPSAKFYYPIELYKVTNNSLVYSAFLNAIEFKTYDYQNN